jgi:hypothetical protein
MSDGKSSQIARRLFLHAGGATTGSVALQQFFRMCAHHFKELGFSYENGPIAASGDDAICGNGEALCAKVRDSDCPNDDLMRTILSYFAGSPNAICSAELFQDCSADNWDRLQHLVSESGIELHVIFFVRDLIPFFRSAYDDAIRQHGEHRSFSVWSNLMKWTHVEALRAIVEKVPMQRVHVIHYDEATHCDFEPLLSVMGLGDVAVPAEVYRNTRVSRSLTRRERETLKSVNAVLGAAAGTDLAELFIESNRRATPEPVWVSPRLAKLLAQRFGDDCAWLNRTFFNDDSVVAIMNRNHSDPLDLPERRSTSTERGVAEKLAFVWALNRLRNIKLDAQLATVQNLSAAIDRCANCKPPGLPKDFDVLVYLTKNPDVLLSGVDPFSHYIAYGKSEGRVYKKSST